MIPSGTHKRNNLPVQIGGGLYTQPLNTVHVPDAAEIHVALVESKNVNAIGTKLGHNVLSVIGMRLRFDLISNFHLSVR